MKHPRDQFLTVYGRKPVLELAESSTVAVAKVFLATKAKGPIIKQIEAACAARNIPVLRLPPEQVSRMSKHPKQDQGVAADVTTPKMDDALNFLKANANKPLQLMALDGITTPANVGLIIRSCTALGMDGLILPRKGSAKLNALVIKASAGIVFRSCILKCERLSPVLKAAKELDFSIYSLSGEQGSNIYQTDFAPKSIFVMGNETQGVSPSTESHTTQHLTIPMANGVESMNVACAASLVASEVQRRRF